MGCKLCQKWFHPECISFRCEECSNEKVKQLEETIQNLQKDAKTRDSAHSVSQSSVKSLEKVEKHKKENGRLKSEMEKKETKYKKDVDSAAEKLSSEKLRNSKSNEEKEKAHAEEVANLKKELENRKREIDIHVKKIVELTEKSHSPEQVTVIPTVSGHENQDGGQGDETVVLAETPETAESTETLEDLKEKL